MNFDTWWDTTKGTATPETYKGWEESCRQAWNAARESQNESLRATLKVAGEALDGVVSFVDGPTDGQRPDVWARRTQEARAALQQIKEAQR